MLFGSETSAPLQDIERRIRIGRRDDQNTGLADRCHHDLFMSELNHISPERGRLYKIVASLRGRTMLSFGNAGMGPQ